MANMIFALAELPATLHLSPFTQNNSRFHAVGKKASKGIVDLARYP